MLKFAAGFVVGFFLAAALVFTFVQTNLTPYYGELKAAQPYVDEAYNISHSAKYVEIESFVGKIEAASGVLAQLPFIGEGVESTHVQEYSREIIDLMQSTRRATERMSALISTAIAAIEMAAWGYWVSIVMVLAGFGLFAYTLRKPAKALPARAGKTARKASKPAAKAKGRRKGKAKKGRR